MATRWGICGTGRICQDFCSALKSLPITEHEILAVAGRQKQKADDFAAQFGVFASYGSYEEMAKDPNVAIVYVGTIHPCHYSACQLFLQHGKHVLCEKPVTMTVQQCKHLVAMAQEKELFFMEAFWTRFFPAIHRLQEVVKQGTLGRINFLTASFCAPGMEVDRMVRKDMGGGGLLDVGCYLVQIANLLFREQPESVQATGHLTEEGVDESGTVVLKYKGGSMAVLTYSINGAMTDNCLTVYGTKGNVKLEPPFHCPTRIRLASGQVEEYPLPDSPYTYIFPNSQGLMYEAQCVRDCLKQGLVECPRMPHKDSIDILTIMEEILKQMGVNYSQ